MSEFTPESGYSKNRTSTVFTDGENHQRADFTYNLNNEWTPDSFSPDRTSVLLTNGSDEQRAVVVYNIGKSNDPHNKGYFTTPEALAEAYPIGEPGDFAIVESTDTAWIWDDDNSQWVDSDTKGQVTSVNNRTGDVTVQEVLVNQQNIKSINGDSILGSGNLEIAAHLTFPNSWPTTNQTTTKAFCDVVAADTSAVEGKMYLGEVYWSDMPNGLVNSECVVEIMKGTTAQTKVIVLTLTSGNRAPYLWKYTYWNGGSNVSGWKGFVPTTDVANKVYGTDENGLQTTYNKDDFGKVDDVKVNNVSIVNNKIANITFDSALDANSTNAIQNGTVTNAINQKSGVVFRTWSNN